MSDTDQVRAQFPGSFAYFVYRLTVYDFAVDVIAASAKVGQPLFENIPVALTFTLVVVLDVAAVEIRIGQHARERLRAGPRDFSVVYYHGLKAPCPCVANWGDGGVTIELAGQHIRKAECHHCKALLRPTAVDCCAFFSHGTVKCPAVQE